MSDLNLLSSVSRLRKSPNSPWVDARIPQRHHTATIHMMPIVSHATRDAFIETGRVAPAVAVGTIPVVLFTAAGITIVASSLPPVRQDSQAIPTPTPMAPPTNPCTNT